MSEKIDYYQSFFGLPYAIKKGMIAFVYNISERGDKYINHYASTSVRKFSQMNFPMSQLRKVVDMPSHIRRALRKELAKAGR